MAPRSAISPYGESRKGGVHATFTADGTAPAGSGDPPIRGAREGGGAGAFPRRRAGARRVDVEVLAVLARLEELEVVRVLGVRDEAAARGAAVAAVALRGGARDVRLDHRRDV